MDTSLRSSQNQAFLPHGIAAAIAFFCAILSFLVFIRLFLDGGGLKERVSRFPPLDLNSAAVDELMLLPGIGEVIARRIVEYRGQNGSFSQVSELVAVRGISERMVRYLAPYVMVRVAKRD